MKYWLVAALLALSGCTDGESAERPNDTSGPDPTPNSAPQNNTVPALPEETTPIVVPAAAKNDTYAIYWNSTAMADGDLFLQFQLTSKGTCEVGLSTAGDGEAGPIMGHLRYDGDRYSGWGLTSSGGTVQVRAGPVDTNTVLAGGGWTASTHFTFEPGTNWVSIITRDLVVGSAGYALQFELICSKPVTLDHMEGSRNVAFFMAESMDGGASAQALIVGGATAASTVEFAGVGKEVFAWHDAWGYWAYDVDHPGGTERTVGVDGGAVTGQTWFRGEPGTYTGTLYAHAGEPIFNLFWGFMADLSPLSDIRQLELLPA